MTTDIQLLRSGVAYKRPAVAPLLDGQAAVNINAAEPGLFFKDSAGLALIKIGPTAVNTTGFAPNSNAVGSTGNSVGETWLDGRAAFANPVMKVWNGLSWDPSNGFEVNDITGEFSFANLLTVQTLESNGVGADSYLRLPQDTTIARATIAPASGMIRFNTSTLAFEGYDGSSWASFSLSGDDVVVDDLTTTGDTILGNNCADDTLTVNSVTQINCNTTIGASNTNTLVIDSVLASNIIPDGQGTRRLGSSTARWNTFAEDLNVASVTTDLIPAVDNTQDLGSSILRWANIHANAGTFGIGTFSGNVNPTVDNTQDLGQPSLRWGNIYAGTVIADSIVSSGDSFTDLTLLGDTVIGTNCANDTLTITAATTFSCDILASPDNSINLGSPTQRFANIYTGDLHFSNEGSDGNDIDGTTGNWTLQEGDENMYFINNKTGAKFRVVMESVG